MVGGGATGTDVHVQGAGLVVGPGEELGVVAEVRDPPAGEGGHVAGDERVDVAGGR